MAIKHCFERILHEKETIGDAIQQQEWEIIKARCNMQLAYCRFMLALDFDPHVSSRQTAQTLITCMSEVHSEMNDLLNTENESLLTSLLGASTRMFEMCNCIYVAAMFSEVRFVVHW